MTHVIKTDVVIVGAGPVGLFSIFQCGMNNLKCHVIDVLDDIGGQCTALYPEKPIYDIPAHPSVLAADLISLLDAQAEPFQPTFHLGQQVVSLEKVEGDDHLWCVKTDKGAIFHAKAIILAAGVGAFGPNRPPLADIQNFEGKSVHYYVKSRESYSNKKIVIAGGGDSAVDWALSLSEVAAKVSVVHRRAKFRAAPESESKLLKKAEEGIIDLIVPYQLSSLEGKDGVLSGVGVESLQGEQKTIEADVLLPFFGLTTNLGPILNWGLDFEKNFISVVPGTGRTNLEGVYAVGDISTYPHKTKLILTGFAEAAAAAHDIRRFLNPDHVVHFEHSTTKGIPHIA
jgi:thioredoxin reductase (NADPH)